MKELAEAGMPLGEAFYIYLMNKRVKAVVETPIGQTEAFKLEEIVKQGTVNAVDLCCISTDRINKLHDEGPKLTVSGVEIKHPVFVDDMAGMGKAEVIENMEPKMNHLEKTKKYVYNNEKGKSEIMRIELTKKKSDNSRNPVVKVKKGLIDTRISISTWGICMTKQDQIYQKLKRKWRKEVSSRPKYAEWGTTQMLEKLIHQSENYC